MERIVYRASSLGGCTKRLIAERLGYHTLEPPERFRTLFAKGDDAERSVVRQMRHRGDRVWDQQRECSFKVSDRVVVEGHVDGLVDLCRGGMFLDSHILEVKSMGNQEFWRFREEKFDTPGIVQKYKWQISAYMHALRLPCWLVVVNRDRPGMIEMVVNEPFISVEDIKVRIFQVEAMARSGELPRECDSRMFPCPVYYLHEDEEEDEDDGKIEALAGTFLTARSEFERSRSSLADVRARLSDALGPRRTVESRTLRVTQYEQRRTTYDYKRALEDGVDLSPYKKESTSTALRVTVRNAPSGGNEPRTDSVDGSVEHGEE